MASNEMLSQIIYCKIPDSELLMQVSPDFNGGCNLLFKLDTLEHNYSAGGKIDVEFNMTEKQLQKLFEVIDDYLCEKETVESKIDYKEGK